MLRECLNNLRKFRIHLECRSILSGHFGVHHFYPKKHNSRECRRGFSWFNIQPIKTSASPHFRHGHIARMGWTYPMETKNCSFGNIVTERNPFSERNLDVSRWKDIKQADVSIQMHASFETLILQATWTISFNRWGCFYLKDVCMGLPMVSAISSRPDVARSPEPFHLSQRGQYM